MKRTIETFPNPNANNTALIGKELSEYSFVPFECYKLNEAELVWLNKDLVSQLGYSDSDAVEKLILDNFAYVTKDYTDEQNLVLKDVKVFLADRYGSPSEESNGGSARCGMNGHFQIKGNGRSPLVAINVDYGHSHGKVCLTEAVAEAIWGEICHFELPYGAVRTLAIIKTKETIQTDYGLGDFIEQPAALIVRELSLRPAHYERAIYFWPEQKYKYLRDSDHYYVKDSVLKLESYAKENFGDSSNPVVSYLCEVVDKMAHQIAISRVKGIPHGSLTSSNIGMDGSFLDFGTITAVPDFDNYVLTEGLGGVWDDHFPMSRWLSNIIYYIDKYSECGVSLDEIEKINSRFFSTREKYENLETSRQCGLEGSEEYLASSGEKIKTALRKNKEVRKNLHGFDRGKFLAEVDNALKEIDVFDSNPNFELRDIFYSKYTITVDKRVAGSGGSNDEIRSMIDSYVSNYWE